MENLISCGEPILLKAEFFGPLFCISLLEVLSSKILCHSLDFNAFSMIQKYFFQTLEIYSN